MTPFERLKMDPNDMGLFGQWYRETYPELFMSAFRVTRGNRAMAEDLCHDAIMNFVTKGHLHKTAHADDALAYLRRMILNALVDHIRKLIRAASLPDDEAEGPDSGETSAVAQEAYTLLLSRLPIEDHEILGMMFSGESLSRIAAAQNLTYTNAGLRVHKIRRIIKELLK